MIYILLTGLVLFVGMGLVIEFRYNIVKPYIKKYL